MNRPEQDKKDVDKYDRHAPRTIANNTSGPGAWHVPNVEEPQVAAVSSLAYTAASQNTTTSDKPMKKTTTPEKKQRASWSSTRRTTSEPLSSMTPPRRPGSITSTTASGATHTTPSPQHGNRYAEKAAKYDGNASPGRRSSPSVSPLWEEPSLPGAFSVSAAGHEALAKSKKRRHKASEKVPAMMQPRLSEESLDPDVLGVFETTTRSAAGLEQDADQQVESQSEQGPFPGAVAVSMEHGQQRLNKGRLTMSPAAVEEDESEVQAHSTKTAVDLEGGRPPPQSVRQESHPTEFAETQNTVKETPRWNNGRFKLIAAVTVLLGIALGIGIPLSRPESSSSEEPADPNARRDAIQKIISLVSDPTALNQAGSPQNLALEWILEEDQQSPLDDENNLAEDISTVLQRYTLAVLFYATQGDSGWVNSRSWLDPQVDECEWQSLSCNDLGLVTSIDTGSTGNRISGAIPPEIGVISSIESLSLLGNSITQLPEELERLTNLTDLDLSENALNGTIPSVVYELTSLETLDLGGNSLSGTISPQISNLQNLVSLELFMNSLKGPLPTEDLPPLRFLSLFSNDLDGNVTELLTGLTDIVFLDVSRNNFVGSIPTEIDSLESLSTLNLGHNDLSSTIPSELGLVTTLRIVELSATGLSGTIPEELANLDNLEALLLPLNSITGSVPEEICPLRTPGGSLLTLVVDCSVSCTCCSACQ